MIAVTGCGRSGTRYITKFWRIFGIHIGHEKWGKHGIASWYLPMNKTYHNMLLEKKPITLFHQVRNPRLVISSMMPRKTAFRHKMIKETAHISDDDSRLLQCMKYWYYWNTYIETMPISMHYKIEDIDKPELIYRMAIHAGVDATAERIRAVRKIPTNDHTSYNTGGHNLYHKIIKWEDMEDVDINLCGKIKRLAKAYGY